MLHRDLMIRANDGSLEKRPDVFHRVRVNIAAHVFLRGVIDRLVSRVRIPASVISRKVISHNRAGFVRELRRDESLESFAVTADRRIKSDFAAAFDGSENHCLVSAAATVNLSRTFGLVHVLRLAAYERLVNLADAAQKRTVGILNRFSDTMAEIPCGLIGYAQSALELQCGHSLLGFANEKDRDEPFTKRQMRIMKD